MSEEQSVAALGRAPPKRSLSRTADSLVKLEANSGEAAGFGLLQVGWHRFRPLVFHIKIIRSQRPPPRGETRGVGIADGRLRQCGGFRVGIVEECLQRL